ncbi:MAG TPA: hypothetical protein VMG38_05820 [Trebonia sp.]|nr:hypothetical protein [Trebonia sp.]
MDFDVLPGPPLAELARTAMARACAAVVGCAGPRSLRAFTVPVRISQAGHPILLPRRGSALARELAAGPAMVTVTVPADPPFCALRLTGMAAPPSRVGPCGQDPEVAGHEAAAYPVTPQSLEFTGATSAPVTLAQYEAAAPDPFRHHAQAVLRHLEDWHMAELVRCVQVNGIKAAECVVPRGLDRFGLELLVFTPGGLASVRLAFPDGPVTGIGQVPASIRAVLTCRCSGGPG